MAKKSQNGLGSLLKPGVTPKEEENKLISLAVELAKKQLIEGTASSQIITALLKLASSRERLEQEYLEKKVELSRAKTELIEAEARQEQLYQNAIAAFRSYNGHENI